MKKRLFVLFAVIFINGFVIGCGGKRKDVSAASSQASNLQTVVKETSIDTDMLDTVMAILDSMLNKYFGSDYTLVYDEDGLVISYWKEGARLTSTRAKAGDSDAVEQWGEMADALEEMCAQIHEILVKSDLGSVTAAVQFFDEKDKDHALIIVVDGKVTYDASK